MALRSDRYLKSPRLRFALLLALGGVPCGVHAEASAADLPLHVDLHEAVIRVPVSVTDAYGREMSGDIPVTVFKPDGAGPHPLLIISHGRSSEQRAAYPRQRFESAARFFVRKGFVVAVPLRLGYGEMAEAGDPEDSQGCNSPRYAPAVAAAAQQIIKVAKYLVAEPDVDPTRLVLVGQSVGGIATVAAAAMHPPGLVAAINFAGGHGGSPSAHPGEPCQASQLRRLYARWGELNAQQADGGGDGASAAGRPPMLWVYTQNDQYFAPKRSAEWAEAYRQAGGPLDYRLLPPVGDDGHKLFAAAQDVWQPLVDEFLSRQGFTRPGVISRPPASNFAPLTEVMALPGATDAAREGYRKFLAAPLPRAYVLGTAGNWGYATGDDALSRALSFCQRKTGLACRFYAVNNEVVWKD
ncbi:alpha/beta hydrolase family protein [Roseateles koreensis]|uniref:Prolyl oligopeptidase family serine peptidase n=1 Tax=Roseateles koreensis TaxID=2987526 RepID=A0ABT5KR73_9BURK|nr:prolyl oligopeptidase family serine peptidase [Roseateles koreensis]MDC8785352.1 prolyl oligopeptidase family serine peptidase [Roseateles koreensis]